MLSNKSDYFKRLLSVVLVMAMVAIFGILDAEAGKITLKFAHQNRPC